MLPQCPAQPHISIHLVSPHPMLSPPSLTLSLFLLHHATPALYTQNMQACASAALQPTSPPTQLRTLSPAHRTPLPAPRCHRFADDADLEIPVCEDKIADECGCDYDGKICKVGGVPQGRVVWAPLTGAADNHFGSAGV